MVQFSRDRGHGEGESLASANPTVTVAKPTPRNPTDRNMKSRFHHRAFRLTSIHLFRAAQVEHRTVGDHGGRSQKRPENEHLGEALPLRLLAVGQGPTLPGRSEKIGAGTIPGGGCRRGNRWGGKTAPGRGPTRSIQPPPGRSRAATAWDASSHSPLRENAMLSILSRRPARSTGRRVRPRLEVLEDRTPPASLLANPAGAVSDDNFGPWLPADTAPATVNPQAPV